MEFYFLMRFPINAIFMYGTGSMQYLVGNVDTDDLVL